MAPLIRPVNLAWNSSLKIKLCFPGSAQSRAPVGNQSNSSVCATRTPVSGTLRAGCGWTESQSFCYTSNTTGARHAKLCRLGTEIRLALPSLPLRSRPGTLSAQGRGSFSFIKCFLLSKVTSATSVQGRHVG